MIPEGAVDPAVGVLMAVCLALFVCLILSGFHLREQRQQFEGHISRAFTRGKVAGAEMERRRHRNTRRTAQEAASLAIKERDEKVVDDILEHAEVAPQDGIEAFKELRNG